ncbi:MAG: DUF5011 domain-containing protein [Bacillus subtilis]|nr:DUF5011 domain-containing protein [Bacillus subtilis]
MEPLCYGNQFYMQNRVLTKGEMYRISFKVKADLPTSLQMQIEPLASGFTAYFDVTTDWVTYVYEFTMTANTITNGKFGFFFGNVNGNSVPTTIYLDDISVTPIYVRSADTTAPQIWGIAESNLVVGATFNPLFGLNVYDHYDKSLTPAHIVVVSNNVNTAVAGTYQVVYELTDSSRNKLTVTRIVNVVEPGQMAASRINFIDGDFELQTAITTADANLGWTLKISGTGAFTNAVFENGYVEIRRDQRRHRSARSSILPTQQFRGGSQRSIQTHVQSQSRYRQRHPRQFRSSRS